jgi:hypothetical protein
MAFARGVLVPRCHTQVELLRREYRALRRALASDAAEGGRYGLRKATDVDPFEATHRDTVAEQKR